MKFVILLAIAIAVTVAQQTGGGDHNHDGNPLHHMIHAEVEKIIKENAGITLDDCASKCDDLFTLSAENDEQMTDNICRMECDHLLHIPNGRGGN